MPSNDVLRKTLDIFERYELFDSEIVRLSTRRDDTNRLERVEFVKMEAGGNIPPNSSTRKCLVYFSSSENDKGGRITIISEKHKKKLIDLILFMSEEDRSVIVNETFPRSNLLQQAVKRVLA